jgi:hypothetical protein
MRRRSGQKGHEREDLVDLQMVVGQALECHGP